ncbi:MAG: hypothetical protein MZV65_02285 [Chromatiales bacterium]|nr:hypothetical protein [Chromatiales bacterium]
MLSSVKSGAAATATRPRDPLGHLARQQKRIQPPIDEPTSTTGPATRPSAARASSNQSPMAPSRNSPPDEAVPGIVEAQEGLPGPLGPGLRVQRLGPPPCPTGSRRRTPRRGRGRRSSRQAMRRPSGVTRNSG